MVEPRQREHPAPRRVGGRHAEPEKRQARLGEDHRGEPCRGGHDDRRHHVGQDVDERDAGVARAERPRSLDIGMFLDGQGHAADDARLADPGGHPEHEADVQHARPEQRHDGHQDQERRERHPRVHQPLQEQVGTPAPVRGEDPECRR